METIGKIFIIVTPLIILSAIKNTPIIKGIIGEAKINLLIGRKLDKNSYSLISDIIIEDDNDSTQIDHVVVSRYGIFVIETKNMSGWIFGSERNSTWTQQHFYKKTKFQNPLRQNYKHVKFIEKITGVSDTNIYSIVVFTGTSEFKTEVPVNVINSNKLIRYIKDRNSILLDDDVTLNIKNKLNRIKSKTTFTDKIRHICNIERKPDGLNYLNTITSYQLFNFAIKTIVFRKIILAVIFIAIIFSSLSHINNLAKNTVASIPNNLTKQIKDITLKSSAKDNEKIVLSNPKNYKGAVYSWKNKDGKKAYSNVGFPTDESYTDGKIELNR